MPRLAVGPGAGTRGCRWPPNGRLSEAGNTSASDPDVLSAAAARASRLLDVPCPEAVTRALMTALGELHIDVGWGAFDAGLHDRTMFHYARALDWLPRPPTLACRPSS